MSNILSVSEITGQIKSTLETNFDSITIKGEISNYKPHSSGHRYFSLKDSDSQISCVMWRSAAARLNFRPEDGMKIIADGGITVFPPRGNYQINIASMRPDGLGELYLAYEKLKKELEEKGWFDLESKKQIPFIPIRIGVSTSATGAAVKDIFSTLERRFPAAQILFRPTTVQGEAASTDIVKAIYELESLNPDVIIIGRGGGSIEDLWCFNTYEIAEAIHKCKIPIISAVGHETDFTIADFIADVRAATPTAAAEIASPKTLDYLLEILDSYKYFMEEKLNRKIESSKEITSRFTEKRVKNLMLNRVHFELQKLDNIEEKVSNRFSSKFKTIKDRLNYLAHSVALSDPKKPLEKGYALLKAGDKIIGKEESIKTYKSFEVHRLNETAQVKLAKLLPKEIF